MYIFTKKIKLLLSIVIATTLLLSGSYFAITRAYTPGDTTGVKKVMPPPYSDPALAGYWSMDDNAASTTVTDLSGNGNNGTAQANTDTKSTTNAVHNRALTFNGTTDYVSVGDSATLSFGSGGTDSAFSIFAWINPSTVGPRGIIAKAPVGSLTNREWFLGMAYGDSRLHVALYTDEGGKRIGREQSSATMTTSTWYYVGFTYDGSKTATGIKIYINGLQVDDTTNNAGTYSGMNATTAPVTVGYALSGTYNYFSGSTDDVRIYSKALTASDIGALYQAGRPRTGDNGFSKMLFPPIDQSVVGWWKLNDAAGQTVVKDWTSNGNTGTSANNITSATGYTGVANTAMTFNGTSDNVDFGLASGIISAAPFTISLWFKFASNVNTFITSAETSGGAPNMNICKLGSEIYFEGTGNANYFAWTYDTNWHHIVFADAGTGNAGYTVYLDGALKTLTTDGALNASTTFYIGGLASSYWMNGSISDVRILSRALSSQEVKRLYMAGRSQ